MKKRNEPIDKEIRFHYDSLVDDFLRAGLSPEEARRRARLEFGAMEHVKDECRDVRPLAWLESAARDLRFAFRTLRACPAFTAAAITTLGLGIGANTAIFQLLDSVRLRSLPVHRPADLVRVQIKGGNQGFGIVEDLHSLTGPIFEHIRRTALFDGVAAFRTETLRLGDGAQSRKARALLASGGYFPTLRIAPAAGRLFTREDDTSSSCATPPVVLSHAFWQSEFGGDRSIIGSRLTLDGDRHEIIGVTPPRFLGLEIGAGFDVALPSCARFQQRPDLFTLNVIARLQAGSTPEQASQQLEAISGPVMQATAPPGYSTRSLDLYRGFRLQAVPAATGISSLREEYDASLWLLFGITAIVLLIACANLANLLLARSSARHREFAIRHALGASRFRLASQALAESVLLATAGTALGLLLARLLSHAVVSYLSTTQDVIELDLAIGWRTLAFSTAACAVTCLACGLAPMLRSAVGAASLNLRSTTGAHRGIQRLLVVVQVSFSTVLVAGALLFLQSFRNLITMDPGFHPGGVLLATADLTRTRATDLAVLDAVRTLPGVEAAAATTNVVVNGGSWSLGIARTGAGARFTWVSPGHFDALRIPLVRGRDLNDRDTAGAPNVVVVNQSFVRRFVANAEPIGWTFRSEAEPGYPEALYQVVGVVKDTRYWDLRSAMPPQCYAASAQKHSPNTWPSFYIRTSVPLSAMREQLTRRLAAAFPGINLEMQVFEKQILDSLSRDRLMAVLSGFFGLLALLLAAVGIYGVIAYNGARRQAEIGVRMALGATRAQVVALVMKESLGMFATGLAIGMAAAFALSRAAASMLFGLAPHDAPTFALTAIVLAIVTFTGSYLPARRAARLDPMAALRIE